MRTTVLKGERGCFFVVADRAVPYQIVWSKDVPVVDVAEYIRTLEALIADLRTADQRLRAGGGVEKDI